MRSRPAATCSSAPLGSPTAARPACPATPTAGAGGWGGSLGPDLTKVYTRYAGRRGLRAWLTAPMSAVMTPVFEKAPMTEEEVDMLIAFFEAEDAGEAETAPAAQASFLLSGVVVAAGLLALFAAFWKNRYRDTRKPLVERTKR